MNKTFEYRLEPNGRQKKKMGEVLEACRSVYNWALEDRKNLYEKYRVNTNYSDQCRYFNFIKTEEAKEIYQHALQDSLKRCDKAFQNFFRRCKAKQNPGYPRFRGAGWYDSFTFPEAGKGGAILEGERLMLSGIGRVRIILHRPTEGKMKTCTVKKKADGWYASFSCELPDAATNELDNPIGIDVGIKNFVVLSNGEKIENPKLFVKSQKKLGHYQRMMEKKKKGGQNREDAKHLVALQYLKVARERKDFHFKLAKKLVDKYNPIVVEDLNISGMAKNVRLSKSIYDAGWGQFISMIMNKAENAGSKIFKISAIGTSQTCSSCGRKVPKKLSQRTHLCPFCGLKMDRDENAAINILQKWSGRPFGEGIVLGASLMTQEASGL